MRPNEDRRDLQTKLLERTQWEEFFLNFFNDIAYAYHAYLYDFVILMEILI